MIPSPRDVLTGSVILVSNPVLQLQSTLLVAENPDRVGLIICSSQTTNVWVSPGSAVAVGNGIIVPSNTTPLQLYMTQSAGLVCKKWIGVAATAPSSVLVIEILWRPDYLANYNRETSNGQSGIDPAEAIASGSA